MSAFDSSGSSFYTQTHPENVSGEAARDNAAIDSSNQSPRSATPPPYTANEGRDDTFDPSPGVADPTFQPEFAQPVPPTLSLPLIAAGLFALWLIFKGDK